VLENNRTKDTERRERNPWRRFYDLAIWCGHHGLRGIVLRRDPICKICNRNPSEIADHIVPHCGDWNLFTDLGNLQGLCKQCHDKKTSKEDGGFGRVAGANSP